MSETTSLIDILRQRRSIRAFRPEPVEVEKIDLLIEAALRSPSSRGRNPWEFIVVQDPSLLARLAQAKEHGSAFLGKAPLAIVVAADPDKCDVWVEDTSIAAIIVQLEAESQGLGSCWAQIRLRPHDEAQSAESYLKELLGLPDRYVVTCVIGIGYPDNRLPGHPYENLHHSQVHREFFKKD